MTFQESHIQLIRDYSASMEMNGAVVPEILGFIYELKLFKLFVPRELDGIQAELPQALRIFEQAARIDGSFGWLVTIGAGGGFFSAFMTPEISAKLFANPKAVIAGSGQPSGKAKLVDGGYEVTGQWKYCSGSGYASFFTANCVIEHEGATEVRAFAFMPEQVRIIRDWRAFGLKATESHSIAVDRIFVPESYTFQVTGEPNLSHPIYQYPFMQFAQTSFASVCIGIALHFVEEARAMADRSRARWDAANSQRYSTFMKVLGEKERALSAAIERFYGTVDATWTNFTQDRELPELTKQQITRDSHAIAQKALDCAHTVFPLLGMSALMEDSLLNRIWRDLHTVAQHAALVPADAFAD